eukprot:7092123-Alexandrium_andersonii.AAC.1
MLFDLERGKIVAHLRPYQFAVWVSGGAEALAKAGQALADTEGFALARLDRKSAISSQGRSL